MSMFHRFLFIVSIFLLGGLISSHAQSATTVLYSDNFELGQGNWLNVGVGDNKDWTRDSGGTPTRNTGPCESLMSLIGHPC